MNTLQSQPIDQDTYSALASAVGDSAFQQILTSFREDTAAHLKQMGQALAVEDAHMVGSLCHQLKSTSQAIGATPLANALIELEQYRHHQQTVTARHLYTQVLQLNAELTQWLDQVNGS